MRFKEWLLLTHNDSFLSGDHTFAYEYPRSPHHGVMVIANIDKVDAAWAKDSEMHIGAGGSTNTIGNRYDQFGRWLNYKNEPNDRVPRESGEPIKMPFVHYDEKNGKIIFINGRHRMAWLRDHGAKEMAFEVSPESAKAFKRDFE